MKITEIERTVSGNNFDNVSAKAILDDGESPIEAAKELDRVLKEALHEISQEILKFQSQKQEKHDTISLLEVALKYAKDTDIPF